VRGAGSQDVSVVLSESVLVTESGSYVNGQPSTLSISVNLNEYATGEPLRSCGMPPPPEGAL
jgi:hypothetical protein